VTGVLVFNFNQGYYKDYLAEAQYRIQNNNAPPPWSPYQRGDEDFTNSVINAKDYHRRNRDLTVLVMVGWWGLNAVEAYVSEMLKNRWSVSDALMARVDPAIIPMPGPNGHSSAIGLKIQFGFK